MRYERLIFEGGPTPVTLEFHPQLTVIAGVGRVERDSLLGELLGAMAGTRGGVHLELVDDDNRHLSVYRPSEAAAKVVDVASTTDVSDDFRRHDGRIDLIDRVGLDENQARRRLRITSGEIDAAERHERALVALAGVEQDRLWAAAERVRDTRAYLRELEETFSSAPERVELLERIEKAHLEAEKARHRSEGSGYRSLLIGAVAAIATIPVVAEESPLALALVGISVFALVASILFRRRAIAAEEAEQRAISEAGVTSYLGSQLRRLQRMLSAGEQQRLLAYAAERRDDAQRAWRELAGGVEADWALEHRVEILALAGADGDVPVPDGTRRGAMTRLIVSRLARADCFGTQGVSLPLVLDDPFVHVETPTKLELLGLISRLAGRPQLLLLTQDGQVVEWARLEALTGDLLLVEPGSTSGSFAPPAAAASGVTPRLSEPSPFEPGSPGGPGQQPVWPTDGPTWSRT